MRLHTTIISGLCMLMVSGCSVELASPEQKSIPISNDLHIAESDGTGEIDVMELAQGDADVVPQSDIDTSDVDEVAEDSDTAPDVIVPPSNCKELLVQHPEYPTDFYEVVPDGQTRVHVYCEMDYDGGGWTLVARSDDGEIEPGGGFGWSHRTGAVDNFDAPYSLGVGTLFSFEELLVASRSDKNNIVDAYHLHVQPFFVADCASTACPTQPEYAQGECTNLTAGEPKMLSNAGFTYHSDFFFLRDNGGDDNYGLFPNGFQLAGYWWCSEAGHLDGEAGLIFVR